MRSCLLALSALSLVTISGQQQTLNGLEDFQSAVGTLGSALWDLFHEGTDYDQLVEWYNSSLLQNRTNLLSNRSALLVKRLSNEISGSIVLQRIFDLYTNDSADVSVALKHLTDASIELYSSHHNHNCCSDVCTRESDSYDSSSCALVCNATEVTNSYFQMAYNGGNLPPLEYSPVFGQGVNFTHSAIHIPVYVYEETPSVLCFVQWSNNLTEILREEWEFLTETHHSITFMFLGNEQSSATRIYPATERVLIGPCDRCPFELVDTFNPKSRPWYVDTVLGTKHVLVLLDMSGSMLGATSDMARLASVQLLNSLSDHDRFRVLRVDDQVAPLGGCFNGSVSATVDNKLAMARIISMTNDSYGIADFGPALDLAYTELLNSSACHKTVVIFTDQHSSLSSDSFGETKNAMANIRIFVFVVGTTGPLPEIEELTCTNGGMAFYINGYSNIINGIQDFFGFFNRLGNQSMDVFTHLYANELLDGLVVTVSRSIITELPDSSRKFLGVVGIDLGSESTEFISNSFLLGPLGYVFGVARSGDLLFHPLTKSDVIRYQNGLVFFDVFYYEFVEPQDDFLEVRKRFLDESQGQASLISAIPVEGRVRYVVGNFTYFFTTVTSMALVLVVKLPTSGVNLLRNVPLSSAQLHELVANVTSFPGEILLKDDRPFCNDWYQYSTGNNSSAREALTRILEVASSMADTNASSAECSPRLYEPLLVDLYATSQVISRWGDVISSNGSVVVGVFAQFTSGLTWCLLESLPCSHLYTINFIAMAEANGFDNVSVFRGLAESGLGGVDIFVRPIKLPHTPSLSVGVLGIIVETDQVDGILLTAVDNASLPESNVFLLDTSGYLVGSTLGSEDEFFSISELFLDLLEEEVFVERTVQGYDIRICSSQENETGSGSRGSVLTGILITLASSSWHLLTTLASLSFHFLVSLPSLPTTATHRADAEATNHADDCARLGILFCVSQVWYYSATPEPLDFEDHAFSCSGSEIDYQIGPVPGTSLVALRVLGDSRQLERCDNDSVRHGEEEYVLPCLCGHQLFRGSLRMTCPVSETNGTLEDYCSSSGSYWTNLSRFLIVFALFSVHFLTYS